VRGSNRRIEDITERRVSKFVLLTRCFQGYHMKEDEMGGACVASVARKIPLRPPRP
jgi:hypothetical protein